MDVFDEAACRYYEGCLIVEIHDHRKTEEPVIKRVAMQPTAESLWTDIILLNEDWGYLWTEDIALEVESKVLVNKTHKNMIGKGDRKKKKSK